MSLLALIPTLVLFIWFYIYFSEALKARTTEQLITVREIKKKQMESYFHQLQTEVKFFAQTRLVVEAMQDFQSGFERLNGNTLPASVDEKLIEHYQSKINQKPYGYQKFSAKDLLPSNDVSKYLQYYYTLKTSVLNKKDSYAEVHQKYHTLFSNFMSANGYHDLFLIDDQTGFIVYTVAKEIDYATNLLTDAYKNTHIAKLFAELRHSNVKNATLISDFDYYLPSDNMPHAFIGTPIFDGDKKIGTLIFQIPIEKIDAIATSDKEWKEEGLGESGECYVMGMDGRMRTNSRFLLESPEMFFKEIKNYINPPEEYEKARNFGTTILLNFSKHDALKWAGAKRKGELVLQDYRGIEVLCAFTKLDVPNVEWIIMAEMDIREAFAAFYAFRVWAMLAFVALCMLILWAAYYFSKAITHPIVILTQNVKSIEKQEFDLVRLPIANNEIGQLQAAFYQMAEKMKEYNDEIKIQNQELAAQRDNIVAQSNEILKKNTLLEEHKTQLVLLNQKLAELNVDLEHKVNERTEVLHTQTKNLQEYAFMNAHLLRGPLTTLMSLLELMKISKNESEMKICLNYMEDTLQKLDTAIREMQTKLGSVTF